MILIMGPINLWNSKTTFKQPHVFDVVTYISLKNHPMKGLFTLHICYVYVWASSSVSLIKNGGLTCADLFLYN